MAVYLHPRAGLEDCCGHHSWLYNHGGRLVHRSVLG
jgi:hypothetical protein